MTGVKELLYAVALAVLISGFWLVLITCRMEGTVS
jgi:hypothetical protein